MVLVGSRFTHSAESRYARIEGDALEKARHFVLECSDLQIAVDHKPLLKIFGDRSLEDIHNTRLRNLTLPYRFQTVPFCIILYILYHSVSLCVCTMPQKCVSDLLSLQVPAAASLVSCCQPRVLLVSCCQPRVPLPASCPAASLTSCPAASLASCPGVLLPALQGLGSLPEVSKY